MYEGWNHHWCDEMEHWSNSMDQTRNWAAIVFCFEGEAWPWDLRQMPQFWWMFHLELDTSGATCMVINRWRWKCFNCLLLNWCQLFCVGSPILVKWSNVDGFHIRFLMLEQSQFSQIGTGPTAALNRICCWSAYGDVPVGSEFDWRDFFMGRGLMRFQFSSFVFVSFHA